jgi:hypothetical protein
VLPVVAQLALPLEVTHILNTLRSHVRRHIPAAAATQAALDCCSHQLHAHWPSSRSTVTIILKQDTQGTHAQTCMPQHIAPQTAPRAGLAYLACTSMTTSAPHVARSRLVRLPRTRLTSLASSWLHLHNTSTQNKRHVSYWVSAMVPLWRDSTMSHVLGICSQNMQPR